MRSWACDYQGTARDRRGAQISIYEMPILPNNFDISHNASRILFRSNYICKATLIPFKQKRKINNLILSGLKKELIAVGWRHSFRNRNRNQDRVGNGSEDYEISKGQNYTKISAQLYWELLFCLFCLCVCLFFLDLLAMVIDDIYIIKQNGQNLKQCLLGQCCAYSCAS